MRSDVVPGITVVLLLAERPSAVSRVARRVGACCLKDTKWTGVLCYFFLPESGKVEGEREAGT